MSLLNDTMVIYNQKPLWVILLIYCLTVFGCFLSCSYNYRRLSIYSSVRTGDSTMAALCQMSIRLETPPLTFPFRWGALWQVKLRMHMWNVSCVLTSLSLLVFIRLFFRILDWTQAEQLVTMGWWTGSTGTGITSRRHTADLSLWTNMAIKYPWWVYSLMQTDVFVCVAYESIFVSNVCDSLILTLWSP